MPMQKKVTRKEDGRYLIYYHFGETATEEETATFEAVEGSPDELPDVQGVLSDSADREAPHV